MTDSDESTKWTSVSIPKTALQDIRAVYEQERDDVYLNQPEPLWAYLLRLVVADEESDGESDE